jgi:hypothetical protein
MCELDQLFVRVAVVRDEGENFWRGPVDGRKCILHQPNQAQHLQRTSFESVDLNKRGA